jgi:hypothetical protein
LRNKDYAISQQANYVLLKGSILLVRSVQMH